MTSLLDKIPKFALKLPASLSKARTMSESPLDLSCSVCEENGLRKMSKVDEILQGNFPIDGARIAHRTENTEALEKGDEEKSEKDDNMEVTCSVSVDGLEKQEFSFTLYDLDMKEKANKQDIEKIVVRSICEALGKTLKLPPSGSRTIKVKLAISPDGGKETDVTDLQKTDKWPADLSDTTTPSPCHHQDYDSSKSGKTASTYLMSSGTEKQVHRCGAPGAHVVQQPVLSPKVRPIRHNRLVSLQKQEVKGSREHGWKNYELNMQDNARFSQSRNLKANEELQAKCQNPQHLITRVHAMESRERKNHYLDLAGIESNSNLPSKPTTNPEFAEPIYTCQYKVMDHSHICTKPPRTKDQSTMSPNRKYYHKDSIHRVIRTDASLKDDLLNLNLNLCDLMPQHRRSKSYDLHESGTNLSNSGLYSPKVKPRLPGHNLSEVHTKNQSSPLHRLKFKHRDKVKQRAMEQVANWIAREHLKDPAETQYLCGKFVESVHDGVTNDKQEHRHLHEHVHHHYHHFVDI